MENLDIARPAEVCIISQIYQTNVWDGGSVKTYEGKRTIDGLVVTVDGRPLDERYDIKQFSKYGFEWTYEGPNPQQLALAILADHCGDNDRALRLSEAFMKAVIANLDNDWTLDSAQIDAALKEVAQV